MFASRWNQAKGNGGWTDSVAVRATSDSIMSPHKDKAVCWPDNLGGSGHYTTAPKINLHLMN